VVAVARINWNVHTTKLENINAAKFNLEARVEFLFCAAFPDSEYADINRSLLKQALQNSGNVTVLMDEFDEVSPIHADKAAVILSELMKTKVGRVWVTSRPTQRERLEKELSLAVFSMKKRSQHFQVNMILEPWMPKNNPNKEAGVALKNQVLKLANHSVNDSNFTGSPLHIKMIARAYELDIERWLRLGFFKLADGILM
jgi:hypothetical protein